MSQFRAYFLIVLLSVLVLSCADADRPAVDPADHASAVAALVETDRAFSDYSRAQGAAEAFHTFMVDSVVWLPHMMQPVIGRDSVSSLLAGDYTLTWEPKGADVGGALDLGYTWGFYELAATDSAGIERVSGGKYVSIWEKHEDGSWKVVLDAGNLNP